MSDGLAIDSVLVLRLSSVGDIVLTEPVVSVLHETYPEADIGYAVKAKFADVVASHPAISRLHLLEESADAMSSLIGEVRDAGYSAVVDLHRNVRTARIVRASGIPLRSAYTKRELGDTIRVRFLRRSFRARKPLVRRYLDALAPLGIDSPTRAPRLYVADSDVAAGTALLEERGVGADGDREGGYASVVPGSMWQTKRWPSDRFARLADGIVAEFGMEVVLLGSAGERSLCDEVAAEAGTGVTNLAGDTTLGETSAVIAASRLFVGNDSGPTHMAMALNVPTVALFGPTDPGQFDHTGHALVYRDLECSACSFYGGERCRLGHWDCMRSIGWSDAMEAASGLVRSRGGRE